MAVFLSLQRDSSWNTALIAEQPILILPISLTFLQGIYYILVREKGFEKCVATGQVVLTGPTSPEILSLEVLDPQGCRFRDGSISIQAQGENLEYSANGGETFQFPSTFSNLERGMYNLVIRNPEFASCLTDTTVTLTDSIWCGQITCVEPDNVAQGKVVSSSGVITSELLGVDGITSGSIDMGTEANLVYVSPLGDTLAGEPFFDVNLGSIHNLEEIRVYPREDCCPEQLEDFLYPGK